MIVESLRTHLIAASVGVPPTEIYSHRMDGDCKEGILLRLPLDGVPIDWNLPGYHKTTIQAIVRSPDQVTGDTIASAVSSALTIFRKTFTAGDRRLTVQQLLPCNLPIIYPRSDGQGIEWSINCEGALVLGRT